jgi:Mg2+ and Co2+ transporter CorA
MISTYTTHNKMTWIDLENPTREEVREIMNTYNISPEVAEDLIDPTIRTRADVYKDFLYFVLHFIHTRSIMYLISEPKNLILLLEKTFLLQFIIPLSKLLFLLQNHLKQTLF